MTDRAHGEKATPEQQQRLADAVNARTKQLRNRTDREVADRGGPSNSTMTGIRHATGPTPSRGTLERLDAGMDWVKGSAWGVLWEGIAPTPIEDPERSGNGGNVILAPVVDMTRGPLGQLLKIRRELDVVIEQLRSGME